MPLDQFNQRDEKGDLTGRDAEHPFNEFGLELGDLKVEISFGYQFLVHQFGHGARLHFGLFFCKADCFEFLGVGEGVKNSAAHR